MPTPATAAWARRGDYGVDAPYAPFWFGVIALVTAIAAIVDWCFEEKRSAMMFAGYSLFFAGNVASYLYTTRRGKFITWARLLDDLQLGGGERVLDLGCGRGAVLTMVAARLHTGRATGIDLWSTRDQSGNAASVCRRNAELEGVGDRIDIETGDMRKLPFADATFDVVLSSLAIHNIRAKADRRQAIVEAVRVLRPGGRIVIADIRATALYARTLRELGMVDVRRRRLGWRFWYGNPIAATMLVTAGKARPASAS